MFDDSRMFERLDRTPASPSVAPKFSSRRLVQRPPHLGLSFTPTKAIVVLVHGTFVPGAEWTRDGSLIRTAIEKEFQEKVEFRILLWTGRFVRRYNNTHAARRRGAERLRRKLAAWARASPTAAFYVVAHSHGGTLALYALSTDPFAPVDGVVCLATPFIAGEQHFDDPLGHGLFLVLQLVYYPVAIALTLVGIGLLGNAYNGSLGWMPRTLTWTAAIPILMFGIGMLGEGHNMLREFFERTFGAWRARGAEVAAGRLLSGVPPTPIFCLTTRRHDEARKALRFAGVLRRLTTLDGILDAITWPADNIRHGDLIPSIAAVTALALSSLVTGGVFAYGVIDKGDWVWAPLAFLAGLVVGPFLAMLAYSFAVLALIVGAWFAYPVLGLIRLVAIVPTMVGYGVWNAWAEYLLMMSPSPTPEGFSPPQREPRSGLDLWKTYDISVERGLLHSALYHRTESVGDVAIWLRARYDLARKNEATRFTAPT
jgi:hypothetical protein